MNFKIITVILLLFACSNMYAQDEMSTTTYPDLSILYATDTTKLVFDIHRFIKEMGTDESHFAQTDTLTLVWIPPADDDLSHYEAFFTGDETVVAMLIQRWSGIGDSLQYVYYLPLNPGRWKVELIAIDLAGNESDKSEPFWFWIDIIDEKPGVPIAVRIIIYERMNDSITGK